MEQIKKTATIQKSVSADMALVNAQTLREFHEEEVFTFRIAAADTLVDRDGERFSKECLEKLAELYVGRPVLSDHSWSAGKQLARVYAAEVEPQGEEARLVLSCYTPRNEKSQSLIEAIEAGVLREASVGVAVQSAKCSICGTDKASSYCEHRPGRTYNGKACVVTLSEPTDAYEISLVAVPAQPKAGVIKAYHGDSTPPEPNEEVLKLAEARLYMEEIRYGGN